MLDRHFFGDVGLAALLAIAIVALARPDPVTQVQQSSASGHVDQLGNISEQDRPVSLLR